MPDEPRDPVREQDEAARRFEEATGRNPMDPAPPAVLHWKNGRAVVYGPSGNPETADVDHFARHGIEVERRPLEELPPGQRGFLGVAGRFPAGTDPRAALGEVFEAFMELDSERGDDDWDPEFVAEWNKGVFDAIDTSSREVSG